MLWSAILALWAPGVWERAILNNEALSLYLAIPFFLPLNLIDLKSLFPLYFFKKILKIIYLKCLESLRRTSTARRQLGNWA